MAQNQSLARSKFTDRASRFLAGLSSIALVLMMCTTFLGVVMRYLFNAPILGNNEIVQLMSVALVMLAMPYATQTDAHVRVDILDGFIGRFGRMAGDLLAKSLAAYVLWILVERAWRKLFAAMEYGDSTNMLQIPLWPFYGLIVLGMGLYVLVLVLQIFDILIQRKSSDD